MDVPATLPSLVHPRPPVSNLVGKDLFLGPCNLAMGSHDQWHLQAEHTVGSRLLAGGVGQTVGGTERKERLSPLPSSPSAKPSQMGAGEAEGRMPLEQISLVLIIQVSGELGPEPQWRGPQLRACSLGVCVGVTSG